MRRNLFLRLLTTATALGLVISACIDIVTPLTAPDLVEATRGSEEDRIIISWAPVHNAGVYFVYRSETADGTYGYIGATAQTTFIDTSVLPEVHYWYVVSAADFQGSAGSELRSAEVEGWSIHIFAWHASTAAFAAELYSLALDVSTGDAYISWAGSGESAIDVAEYVDGGWNALGESFGITDGTVNRALSLAVYGGDVQLAYRDESTAGKLSAARFVEDPAGDTWTVLGSAGQTTVPVRGISAAATDGGTLYVVALDDSDPLDPAPSLIALEHTAAGTWTSLTPFPVPAAGTGSNPRLVSSGATVALAYEEDGTPVSTLRCYTYTAAWTPFAAAFPVTPGNIPDGYFDFCIDTTNGSYAVAYFDGVSETIQVFTYAGAVWSDISPAGVVADPAAASLGLAADYGEVYLYYRDLAESSGIVMKYDGSAWSVLPQDADRVGITGQFNVSSLDIEAGSKYLYAAARENSALNADVYE